MSAKLGLKISELADASRVSAGTIKHYLREGIEAIVRFRAGGYDEALGFTVYDTLRYREALAPLVEEEARVLLERLSGEVDAERAVEIIRSGREPLRELIGAMHSKLLHQALERAR